jgi:hypothetical protein
VTVLSEHTDKQGMNQDTSVPSTTGQAGANPTVVTPSAPPPTTTGEPSSSTRQGNSIDSDTPLPPPPRRRLSTIITLDTPQSESPTQTAAEPQSTNRNVSGVTSSSVSTRVTVVDDSTRPRENLVGSRQSTGRFPADFDPSYRPRSRPDRAADDTLVQGQRVAGTGYSPAANGDYLGATPSRRVSGMARPIRTDTLEHRDMDRVVGYVVPSLKTDYEVRLRLDAFYFAGTLIVTCRPPTTPNLSQSG